MRQLDIFNFMSLEGYFKDTNEDLGWHLRDKESMEFFEHSLIRDNILLLGRVTYLTMSAFWSSPRAAQSDPRLANKINAAQKIVFSRSLGRADWSNTTLVNNGAAEEARKMKQEPGRSMTIWAAVHC